MAGRAGKGASRGSKGGKKSSRSRAGSSKGRQKDHSSDGGWIRLFFYAAILIGVGYAATRVPVGGKTLSEHLGAVELWSRTRHAAKQAAAAFSEGEPQESQGKAAQKAAPSTKTGKTLKKAAPKAASTKTETRPASAEGRSPKQASPAAAAPPSTTQAARPTATKEKGEAFPGPVPTLAGPKAKSGEKKEVDPRSDLGDRPPAEKISASERMALEELLPR